MAKKKEIKNTGPSVREKLLNIAKRNNLNYDSVLLQYFQERFLYRVSISDYKDNFILKGGLSFLAYQIPQSRPTKDIDLLGRFISSDFETIKKAMYHIVSIQNPDGIIFFPETITVEKIKKDQIYEGINVKVKAELARARKVITIDIGFGDKLVTGPIKISFPVLLDFPAPQINVYSQESVIAEKFEAIVILQLSNSRMKDFYDIWYLASTQAFKYEDLYKSIYATFNQRKTSLENRKLIFTEEFRSNPDKQSQWRAFLLKNSLYSLEQFAEVMSKIELFLEPLFIDISHQKDHMIWNNRLWKWVDKNLMI